MYLVKATNEEVYANRAKLTSKRECASVYQHPSSARKAVERLERKFPGLELEVVRAS